MIERAIIDWQDGVPRSRRFDDVYFSRAGGLDEARAVFLAGCGLPQTWSGRSGFTVGELGFGSGLNVLALLQLWRRTAAPGARLRVFSVEAWPMPPADARRALAAWPELADLAAPLLDGWPQARGFHRIDLPAANAVLDLAVLEAAQALQAWDGAADAWFLDGFSPSRNPDIWREAVLALVAARSAPGARLASFTVAGQVRRGLQAQGFEVSRHPGFGGKAERLEARLTRSSPSGGSPPEGREGGSWNAGGRISAPLPGFAGTPPKGGRSPRIAIVGAGIAGAALARAFRAEGASPVVFDAVGVGAGASGNPAALVTPRLDAGGGPPAQLHAQAFARASDLYARLPGAAIARGALQLEVQPRDRARFDKLAASDLFAEGDLVRLDSAEAGARLGEPVEAGGLWLAQALVIEPAVVLRAWLEGCGFRAARVERLQPAAGRWRLIGEGGEALDEADVVCIAAGHASGRLWPLELEPVRGQASFAAAPQPPAAAAWGGYVIPTRQGLLFGATHDRGQAGQELRPEDHARNLAVLAQKRPVLAAALQGAALEGRAGVRASTRDRLPLAGGFAQAPGLHVLCGLGGRGFCLAPLLAEHIAAGALGLASPLPVPLVEAVRPERASALAPITRG